MTWSDAARAAALEARRRKLGLRIEVAHPGTGKHLTFTRTDLAKKLVELRKISRADDTKRGKLRRTLMQLKAFRAAGRLNPGGGENPGWSDAARKAALEARRRNAKPREKTRVLRTKRPEAVDVGPDPTNRQEAAAWFRKKTGGYLYIGSTVEERKGVAAAIHMTKELDRIQNEFDISVKKVRGNPWAYSSGGLKRLHIEQFIGNTTPSGQSTRGEYHYRDHKIAMALSEPRGDRPLGGGIVRASNRWTVGDSVVSTFRHEFGHASMAKLDARAAALKLPKFEDFHNAGLGSSVSQYARTNHRELFAESFSLYTAPEYQGGGHGPTQLPHGIHDWFSKTLPKRRKR